MIFKDVALMQRSKIKEDEYQKLEREDYKHLKNPKDS